MGILWQGTAGVAAGAFRRGIFPTNCLIVVILLEEKADFSGAEKEIFQQNWRPTPFCWKEKGNRLRNSREACFESWDYSNKSGTTPTFVGTQGAKS